MQQKKHLIDVLFVLALFGVFAFSALILVSIGANVYANTVNHMDSNYELRTSTSYLIEKVRQNDTFEQTTFYDKDVLCFPHEVDGNTYNTYLYLHDGYLKELTLNTNNLNPGSNILSAGQNIVPLKDLSFNLLDNGLVEALVTSTNGELHNVILHCPAN